MNKIQEANAIAKNSEVNFEFGFQTSDQLFVKVIRGKKYKAYWEQPYFLEMLEILINEGTDSIIKTGLSEGVITLEHYVMVCYDLNPGKTPLTLSQLF